MKRLSLYYRLTAAEMWLEKCLLEKCGLCSEIQYGFSSSRSTADLLTVVSDRIARTFNRSRATQAVALDISKAFGRVCILVFFTSLNIMEF